MLGKIRNTLTDLYYSWGLRHLVRLAQQRQRQAHGALLAQIRKDGPIFALQDEVAQLVGCVRQAGKCSGAFAEVGVFEGGTAKLIAQFKGTRPLFLFDTFMGLPEVSPQDSNLFFKGQFAARKSLIQLREEFTAWEDIHIHPGLFPQETGHLVENQRFAFVHLDVDIYSSTLRCLEFFYPRMPAGGILLSHDFLISQGVRQAFEEFFAERPEPIIPAAGSQCLIVKCAC